MRTIRKALVTMLILLITLPCITTATASTFFIGYVARGTCVYKKASTSSKKVRITKDTRVYVFGKSGKFYKVYHTSGTVKGYVLKSCVSRKKVTTPSVPEGGDDTPADTDETETDVDSWKSKVVKLDWYKTGKNVLRKGGYGYIYDITTGIKLRVKRMGGTSHADVEPATASDTAKL